MCAHDASDARVHRPRFAGPFISYLCIPKGLRSVEKQCGQSATCHVRHTQRFFVCLSVSGAPKSKILKIESFKAEIRILVKILIPFVLRLN